MKKIFTLLVVAIATSVGLYAQKSCNLGLRVSVTGSPVAYGDTAWISATIKNLGPQNIAVTDTMFFGLTGNATVWRLSPTSAINTGDSFTFSNRLYVRNDTSLSADLTRQYCFTLYNQSQITVNSVPFTVTYVDNDTSNNNSCVPITLKARPGGTGINNSSVVINDLALFPNPAKSDITLSVPTIAGTATIIIKDIAGRTVLTKDLGIQTAGDKKFNIDIAALPNGIYLLQYNNAEHLGLTKFTITH